MNNLIECDTPDKIKAFRMLSLRGSLKLQIVGMQRRGFSAFKIIKEETGLKARSAKELLPKYEDWLRAQGILT